MPTRVLIPESSRLAFINNNPGNLRFAGQPGGAPGEGGFARFPSAEEGFEQLVRQIRLDSARGLSLTEFTHKFSPPHENDTDAIIRHHERTLGVGANTRIDQIDPIQLARSIAQIESGTQIEGAARSQPTETATLNSQPPPPFSRQPTPSAAPSNPFSLGEDELRALARFAPQRPAVPPEVSERPLFVRNALTRNFLSARGVDPDDPTAAVQALQMGMPLGEQPSTGRVGEVLAALSGFTRSIENTGRGVLDLPFAAARFVGATDMAIPARPERPVETVNPIASGIGQLAGIVPAFIVPELMVGRLAHGAGAMGRLTRAGQIAEAGIVRSEAAQLARALAPRGVRVTADDITDTAFSLARRGGPKGGLTSGLDPVSMLARGVRGGTSFATFEALQPGDIEDRLKHAATGFVAGATLKALGAPRGVGFGVRVPREALAGGIAFGQHPILPDVPIPAAAQGAILGGLGRLLPEGTARSKVRGARIEPKDTQATPKRERTSEPGKPDEVLDALIRQRDEGGLPPNVEAGVDAAVRARTDHRRAQEGKPSAAEVDPYERARTSAEGDTSPRQTGTPAQTAQEAPGRAGAPEPRRPLGRATTDDRALAVTRVLATEAETSGAVRLVESLRLPITDRVPTERILLALKMGQRLPPNFDPFHFMTRIRAWRALNGTLPLNERFTFLRELGHPEFQFRPRPARTRGRGDTPGNVQEARFRRDANRTVEAERRARRTPEEQRLLDALDHLYRPERRVEERVISGEDVNEAVARERGDPDLKRNPRHKTKPPKKPPANPTRTAEAVQNIGRPGMGDKFPHLSPEQMERHTARRVLDETDPRRRMGRLRRLAKDHPEEWQISKAASRKRLMGASEASRQAAIERKLREIDPELELVPVLTTGPRGELIRRFQVVDRRSGTYAELPNLEAAAFAFDGILRMRMTAPDWTPPGVFAPIPNFNGPRAPRKVRPGPKGPDGRRLDGVDGEGFGLEPPLPLEAIVPAEASAIPRRPSARATIAASRSRSPVWRGFRAVYNRWFNSTKRTLDELARNYPRVFEPIKRAVDDARVAENRMRAQLAERWVPAIQRTAIETGLFKGRVLKNGRVVVTRGADPEMGRRLTRASRFIDDELYAIQRARGIGEARANEARVRADARTRYELSEAESNFLKSMNDGPLKEFWVELGLPAEFVVGYFPRYSTIVRLFGDPKTLERMGQIDASDPLMRDFTLNSFPPMKERMAGRFDPRKEREVMNALSTEEIQLARAIENGADYFDIITGMMNSGLRRKFIGDALSSVQAKMMTNRHAMTEEVVDFMRNEVRRLAGLASESDLLRTETKRQHLLETVLPRYRRALDKLESERPGFPEPVRNALLDIFKRLEVGAQNKAARAQLGTAMDWWARMYRSSVFGLSAMRAARDVTTTTLFFQAPRFEKRVYARALKEAWLDAFSPDQRVRENWVRQVERWVREGKLSPDTMPELRDPNFFRAWSASSIADKATWFYSKADRVSRFAAIRAAELGVEKALPRFLRSKRTQADFENFLIETGLDGFNPSEVSTLRAELNATMSGASPSMAKVQQIAARMHVENSAFNFSRSAAPPYQDFAAGRFLGQFGTWPINAVSTIYWMVRGPSMNLTGARAARRTASMVAQYALAYEALITLGAQFNADLADWAPGLHNLSFDGGPGMSLLDEARGIMTGDPETLRRFNSAPGRELARLARQNIPLPASGFARNLFSQLYELGDDDARRVFGLPDFQRSIWDRFLIAAQFRTFNDRFDRPRFVGIPQGFVLDHTVGPLNDRLFRMSGIIPPLSEEEINRFQPFLGGN